MSKTKLILSFNIWYTILHTCNINDNRVYKVTLLSISELYGIPFNVKEKIFVLKMIKLKDPWLLEMHRHSPPKSCTCILVNIACKFIIDNNVYTE